MRAVNFISLILLTPYKGPYKTKLKHLAFQNFQIMLILY
jgi:hypothetical protein